MNILHIDSCALGDRSVSRRQSAAAVGALVAITPAAHVVYRDLAAAPLSHVSGPLMQVLRQQWDPTMPMNAELQAEVLQSDALRREFIDADVVVLAAPPGALGSSLLPSTLQVWLDRLLLAAADLPLALARDKRILLVLASGDLSAEQPDTLQAITQHWAAVFQHLGVGAVETFHSEQALRQAA